MEISLINKKTVRKNKEMKKAQKIAKKYYGRVRGKAPKAKIGKVVDITDIAFIDLTEQSSTRKTDRVFGYNDVIDVCEKYNLTGRSGNGYPVANKLKEFKKKLSDKKY